MASSLYVLSVILCALIRLSCAQNFTVPSNWINPTSELTRDQRVQIAYAAEDVLLPFLPNGTVMFLHMDNGNRPIYDLNFSGIFALRALARTDFLTGNTTFKNITTAYLKSTVAHFQNSRYVSPLIIVNGTSHFLNDKINAVFVGLVAMDVHFAYNDSTALTIADYLWNQLFPCQMQSQQASAGVLQDSSYNVTFSSSCNNQSVKGAVLRFYPAGGWPQWSESFISSIGGEAVGSYFALSSQLYKATTNTTYLVSAILAAQFIQYQLYSAQIIQSSLNISSCVSNSTQRPDTNGFVLEGLAALSSANHTEFNPIMRTLISTTLTLAGWSDAHGTWSQGDIALITVHILGVNYDRTYFATPAYMRGLHEAWTSMDPQDPAALLIQSFFMVQYNALLGLASMNNSYSSHWTGPPPDRTRYADQAIALDVLSAAITLGLPNDTINTSNSADNSSSSISTTGTATTSSNGALPSSGIVSSSNVKKPVGRTVGAVIGGVSALLLLLSALIFWRRRVTVHKGTTYNRDVTETSAIPFVGVQPQYLMNIGDSKGSPFRLRSPPNAVSPEPIDPAMLPQSVETGEVIDINHDTAGPSSHELGQPENGPGARSVAGTSEDIAAVPVLVERLNRIMARLPPGGILEDEPPAYGSALTTWYVSATWDLLVPLRKSAS